MRTIKRPILSIDSTDKNLNRHHYQTYSPTSSIKAKMMTDISFSSSSLYNFETDSSSSYASSSLTNHSYVLQPQQTRNLKSLLTILDSRENFKELMGLLDGQMAFQKMLTIDHIHSTIWRMEHEIRKQKARATMLFEDILHAKKS